MNPEKLKICGHEYTIEYHSDMDRHENRTGCFDKKRNLIKIDGDYPLCHQLETIIHEVIEAIDSSLWVNLKHDEQICKLDNALFATLTDNANFWIEKLEKYKK